MAQKAGEPASAPQLQKQVSSDSKPDEVDVGDVGAETSSTEDEKGMPVNDAPSSHPDNGNG